MDKKDSVPQILIIDDDPRIRDLLVKYLKECNFMLMVAEGLSDGMDILSSTSIDLVLLDVNLPDGNGLEALPAIKNVDSKPEVLIITAEGNTQGARMALDSGAWDYIVKPFSVSEIKLNVTRALEFRKSRMALTQSSIRLLKKSGIIGNSPKLVSSLHEVAKCSRTDANVLITGQSGTGKEMFAKIIYKNSNRGGENFVVVDCAALPEQLVESVLFGNKKGAFTGADADREGLVTKADGGTLFLDEIGELPLSIQKKFLRVLQERKFKPVGGTAEIKSDFRLISATNRNLEKMVGSNEFRKDLLFRLKTFHIHLPPLKECKEDIKDLALHYIHSICNRYSFETKGFVPEFLQMLELYDWPGNTRELISCLERAILTDPETPVLYTTHLPVGVRLHHTKSSMEQRNGFTGKERKTTEDARFIRVPKRLFNPVKPFKQVKEYGVREIEKIYMKDLMETVKGDLEQASAASCLSKTHIYSLLKKHNISRK